MDFLSLTIGFVTGALTGAAGSYLGNKYTDKRRASEANARPHNNYEYLRNKFPELIQEMINDINNPTFTNIRVFFVKNKSTILNFNEPHFQYFTDDHPNIQSAMSSMQVFGFIKDITPGNCPKYLISEQFYDLLRGET